MRERDRERERGEGERESGKRGRDTWKVRWRREGG